jgi:hypothetical protein
MSYFDLDPASDVNSVTNAALNPITPGDLGYGVVRGTLQGTGQGLLQGIVAQPAMIAADLFTPMLMPGAKKFDDYFGGTSAEDFLKSEQQKSAATVHALMPGPQIGTIGQIGYSLGSVVPQAVEGALIGGAIGGPAGAFAGMVTLPSAIQGYSAKRMGETYEGLDPTTATYKGLLEGGATAAGIALPGGFGAKTAISMAVGAATNVGVGMAQRYSTQQLLEARGYPEQAKQYETFDKTSIATDLILGLAFGGLHARGKAAEAARAGEPPAPTTPNIPPSVVDEALATNKQQHLEIDTAPGVPLDPQSRTVHGKAIDKAIQDVMADEPVDVSQTGIDSAEFVPNRAVMEAQVARAIEEEGSLRTTLDAVDELRAELESRGLAPADEALFVGDRLQDAYDEVSASGARDLPGAVHGRDGEVFVGDRSEPVRFMVVDAGALKATMEKADNQYRDRSRTASQLQITKIANDLQFGRLGEAPTMAEGAPTLAQSGEIVGGNGRVAAIQQAYAGGKGDGYKLALEQRAAEFGLTPEAVRGMTEPVLVRQFTRPVDVKLAAILSNEGGALRMSALEQAKVDAERMPELAGVEMPESGDLAARSLDNFRKQWLSQYPQNELGEFVASDGKLSKQGEKRMVNAILFKAYGDSPALERMVESTDDLSKNLTNALLKSAQNVAEARDMIAVGDLHDLDIQPQLLQAFDTTQSLKAEGVKLDSYLAQNDMFGSGIGPEAVLWMEHFAKNTRSAKAIGESITGYYDAVRALGNPRQANIFDAQPPSRGEILRAVLKDEPVPVVKPAESDAKATELDFDAYRQQDATSAEQDIAAAKPAEQGTAAEPVVQILDEKPNAQVMEPSGDVIPAAVALKQADDAITKVDEDAPGYDAAAACASR